MIFLESTIIDNETLIEELGRSKCPFEHDLHSCIAKLECGYCVKKDYQEVNRCDTLHRMKVTDCEKDIFEPIDKKHEAIIEPNKIIDAISVHL